MMGKKVCVIDDDERVCNLVRALLTKEGYEVMTLSKPLYTNKEIVKFMPDLVVLDIEMPWLTGDSIADILGYSFSVKPKVIFFSSKPLEELALLAKEREVDGFVCKTEGPRALLFLIRALLHESESGAKPD